MQAAFLFSLIVKATILLVGAWACARLLSRSSAAARSAVWAAGLILAAALPFAMLLAPSWSVNAPPLMSVGRTVGAVVADFGIDGPTGRRGSAPSPLNSPVSGSASTQTSFRVTAVAGIWRFALAFWLLGALAALAHLGAGFVANLQIRRAAESLDDPSWTKIVAQGCTQVGLAHPPAVRVSRLIAVPAVSGVLKPVLMLPPEAREWSESCRAVVVLHELAHLKRRDCLVQLLSDISRAFYWFHPLMHAAAARLRQEREHACDDVVIAAGTSATVYADHLLDVVRAGMKQPPAPAVAFGAPGRLHDRIGAILDDGRCRRVPAGRTVVAALAAGLVAVVALGGARLTAQAAAAGQVGDLGGGVITRVITGETRQRVKDALAAALRDGDIEVQSAASTAMQAMEAFGDAPFTVRTPCRGNCVNWDVIADPLAKAMQKLRDEAAVMQLASDDVEVRRAAVVNAWPRTQRGAAALARALLDDDRVVRNGAAIRLDSVHAPVAVSNWIVLLRDADPMLRERAAISLGVIGDSRAIDPLGEVLRDPETTVRLEAARALASIAVGVIVAPDKTVSGRWRRVYRKEDGVTLPEVVREVRPGYTPAAIQARIQGGVVMKAVVEADGSVNDVEVVESLDAEHGLDQQATTALKQWAFKPGLRLGEPVPVLITVDMRFTLK